MTHQPIQSMGFLRVSQRALDQKLSTGYDPVLANAKEECLVKGEIVPVDIAIWPMGMKYHQGESLRLTVAPYQAPDSSSVSPFGKAKISIPAEGYTYNPAQQSKMRVIGGNENEVANPKDQVKAPASRNHGLHVLHMGGKYASYLQVPVIPEPRKA